jgi:hypothetical protein
MVSMGIRANINLDADAYSFASAYASAKGIPLGAAVSELLRRIEQTPKTPDATSSRLEVGSRGYLVRARAGRRITPDMAKEGSEDEIE